MPRRSRGSWPHQIVLVVVFLTFAIVGYWPIIASGTQYDDSFITYRYAANLAEGRGLTFNSSERVNSASSLLYTAILAVAYRSGLTQLDHVASVVGMLAGCLALLVGFRLAMFAAGSSAVAFCVMLPIAISGAWTGWATSGMETTFYALTVVSCVAAYVFAYEGLTLGLLVACLLARPEAALLWLSLMGAEYFLHRRASRFLVQIGIVGMAVLTVTYLFFFNYYGSWLPQPVVLKTLSPYYSPGIAAQAKAAAHFFVERFGALSIAATLGLLWQVSAKTRSEESTPRHCLAWVCGLYLGTSLVSLVLGPHSDLMRYAVHTLPLIAVGAACVWGGTLGNAPPRLRQTVLAAFLAVSLVQAGFDAYVDRKTFMEWSSHQAARRRLGSWLEQHGIKGSLVISSDVGAIAYEARSMEFYDMIGLLSRGPLEAAQRHEWGGVWRDLNERRPLYICDTVLPSGELQAERVLRQPQLYFRGVPPVAQQALGQGKRELISIPSGPYSFALACILWTP